MKIKLLSVGVMAILLLTLAACKNSGQAGTNSTTGNSNSGSSAALSQVNMLLVGTLKLESTENAVSAEEAATLLPLWQAYLSLSNSQTAAEAEVDALINQIESSMTAEQVQAIKALNLTSTDMIALMQSLGVGMRPGGTPDPQSTPAFDINSNGFPGGAPPSGDFQSGSGGPSFNSSDGPGRNAPPGGGGFVISGGPGGDAGSDAGLGLGGGQTLQGTPDPSMQATAQARFSTQANQANLMLLNVLISKLEAMRTN